VSTYQDKTLTCRDCGREFAFTASEQEFYAQRGYTNEPGRCPECRAARKAQRGESSYSSGGGYGGGGGYGAPRREMYPAVCAQCGKETQVPFQPRGDRPVYCSDCYAQMRGSTGGGYERRGGGGGGRRRY
jgi:CxxC-x17-CxxC domain-containing protein